MKTATALAGGGLVVYQHKSPCFSINSGKYYYFGCWRLVQRINQLSTVMASLSISDGLLGWCLPSFQQSQLLLPWLAASTVSINAIATGAGAYHAGDNNFSTSIGSGASIALA